VSPSSSFIHRGYTALQPLAYDPSAWRDAIVVVEDGVIDVERLAVAGHRFERAAVLCREVRPYWPTTATVSNQPSSSPSPGSRGRVMTGHTAF